VRVDATQSSNYDSQMTANGGRSCLCPGMRQFEVDDGMEALARGNCPFFVPERLLSATEI